MTISNVPAARLGGVLALCAALACVSGPARAARARDAAAATDSALAAATRADSAAADTLPLRLVATQALGAAGERAALVEPSGVGTDAFGRVYVTDATQHRLVRFDPKGAWIGEAGALGSDPGDLRRPAGVARVGALGMAVLDRENRRLVQYDLFGRFVGVLADLAALEDQVGRVDPVAVAADRGGALYVADADRDRLLVLDFSGRYQRSIGGYGAAAGSFRGLAGVACGPRGELVTAERAGARVQRLDSGGNAVASWPVPARPGRGALAVAEDDSARVAVADEPTGRLWLFDRDGGRLAYLAGLAGPRALAFAPDGTLLVAESAAGRVRRFTIETSGTAPPAGR